MDDLMMSKSQYQAEKQRQARRRAKEERLDRQHLISGRTFAIAMEVVTGIPHSKIMVAVNEAVKRGVKWGVYRRGRRPVAWIRDQEKAQEFVFERFNVIFIEDIEYVSPRICVSCGVDVDDEAAQYPGKGKSKRYLCDECIGDGWRFLKNGQLVLVDYRKFGE